jgi:acyl-CoA hydrolase
MASSARVDRIRQSRKISATDDLILTGQVVWVGSSSLDVLMEIHRVKDMKALPEALDAEDGGAVMIEEKVPSRLLSSLFTYVARDRGTGKACAVNRFVPTGKAEEDLCLRRGALAQSRKLAKKKGLSESKGESASVLEAQAVLLSLVERGSAMVDMPALASSNSVLMRLTALENSLVCQPQNVNMAGRVFGGYLSESLSAVLCLQLLSNLM